MRVGPTVSAFVCWRRCVSLHRHKELRPYSWVCLRGLALARGPSVGPTGMFAAIALLVNRYSSTRRLRCLGPTHCWAGALPRTTNCCRIRARQSPSTCWSAGLAQATWCVLVFRLPTTLPLTQTRAGEELAESWPCLGSQLQGFCITGNVGTPHPRGRHVSWRPRLRSPYARKHYSCQPLVSRA